MSLFRRLDPRRSLALRLVIVNLAVIIVALGGLVLWSGYRLQAGVVEEAEHRLEIQAMIVANGMVEPLSTQLAYEREHGGAIEIEEDGEDEDDHELRPIPVYSPIGDRDFKALVDAYADQTAARVTILDPSLFVRYSSDADVPIHTEDRHPEIVAALQGQEQYHVRFDEWSEEERIFVAAPVGNSETPRGLVQLSVPMSTIQDQIRNTWVLLISSGLLLAVLSVIASILIGRQITRPVHALTIAANQLADGDLGTRLDLERKDELGILANAFDHMAEQISRLLAKERTFVANASHELRSPLTAIQLRAELLQSVDLNDCAHVQRYLAEIGDETARLSQLLRQLLDLNRMQSAPAASATLASPSDCLARTASTMAPLADHAQVTLNIYIPSGLPPVALDASDCELLVRNLLDNAIKYTRPGGEVNLSASAGQGQIEIVVADTGIGIPPADLPLIFDRFYRVDKARDGNGSGLGLALVKEIVTQRQGEISVTSEVGNGSRFVVTLPIISD
ncbi:MAG: HAMP domain-containing histidine kinase [Caldilineales bacterium]|nr:HAMP domain-containing histidine kinase [Caldilineales bacterium]